MNAIKTSTKLMILFALWSAVSHQTTIAKIKKTPGEIRAFRQGEKDAKNNATQTMTYSPSEQTQYDMGKEKESNRRKNTAAKKKAMQNNKNETTGSGVIAEFEEITTPE
jgi:hypothetical protein